MLKIAVFDGGFGGELFADLLEKEVPVIEVIRVIDWRHAKELTTKAKEARRAAEEALEPYIGKVDLVVFANHLLTMTSLRYFRRKYPEQKFLGLELEAPTGAAKRDFLVLTTGAVTRTLGYWSYVLRLKAGSRTLKLDAWPELIDDGALDWEEIAVTLEMAAISRKQPRDIILACSTFTDIKKELKAYFNQRVKIYDGFDQALKATCRILGIKGASATGRKT